MVVFDKHHHDTEVNVLSYSSSLLFAVVDEFKVISCVVGDSQVKSAL